MKLQAIIYPLLIILLNNNCKGGGRSNMPVEQTSAQAQTTAVNNNTSTNDLPAGNNDTTSAKTKFGVMVSKTDGMNITPQRQAQVVKALGANYTRARIDMTTWNGSNNNYDAYAAAGLKVLLNVNYGVPRNAMGEHNPIPFPTDMAAYSNTLNSILDKYKPEVLVIENEEDNPLYHSGPAQDYINLLKTAIDIAHKHGVKVTNGGITVREVCLIVYDDLLQKGKQQEANDFLRKVAGPNLIQRLQKASKNTMLSRQIEFGRTILAAYKTLDIDYLNFHWYEPVLARNGGGPNAGYDNETLSYVINYLKAATGKPVMTNEFGVLNPSPALVKNVLQGVRSAGVQYAIFYSADGDGDGKAVALQNGSGDLRDNGVAFKEFIQQLK